MRGCPATHERAAQLPEPSLSRGVTARRAESGGPAHPSCGRRRDPDHEADLLTRTLELFPIGNSAASALVDEAGRFVWACTPRVDGDPFFCALLGGRDPAGEAAQGLWAIEAEDTVKVSQAYLR